LKLELSVETIRIGVAGLGTRAALGWIPLLQRISGYRITAIFDPLTALHERALAQISERQAVRAYSNYEEFLADEEIDAVALCVRCEEQGALAAQALEAGKHVSAEVPAAHRMEDCWRIVLATERTGKIYHLAEQVRYAGYVNAWHKLVNDGQLGHVTYAEGQYFHYYVEKSFQDPKTGRFFLPHESTEHPEAQRTWLWHMPPIHYIVHDFGPLLKILDDRVIEVTAMSTRSPSYAHPELGAPDMQVALMKTAKDTIMRLATSFNQPFPKNDYHWLQLLGSAGSVEWRRTDYEKPKLWLANQHMHDMAEVDWRYQRTDEPIEARGTGHSNLDYYVHVAFRDAVLQRAPLEYDVYKAMDTTAPAILAADSIAKHSQLLAVPDFRPNASRAAGQMPTLAA
jgi:predicted dehydrogenase